MKARTRIRSGGSMFNRTEDGAQKTPFRSSKEPTMRIRSRLRAGAITFNRSED